MILLYCWLFLSGGANSWLGVLLPFVTSVVIRPEFWFVFTHVLWVSRFPWRWASVVSVPPLCCQLQLRELYPLYDNEGDGWRRRKVHRGFLQSVFVILPTFFFLAECQRHAAIRFWCLNEPRAPSSSIMTNEIKLGRCSCFIGKSGDDGY